jgi:hypothetical protein
MVARADWIKLFVCEPENKDIQIQDLCIGKNTPPNQIDNLVFKNYFRTTKNKVLTSLIWKMI